MEDGKIQHTKKKKRSGAGRPKGSGQRVRYQGWLKKADGTSERFSRWFDSEKDKKDYLARVRTMKNDGIAAVVDRKTVPTFKEYADAWLKDVHSAEREPETVQATINHLVNHIYKHIGSMKLVDVGSEHVEAIKEELMRDGYKPQTISNIISSVSKVFTHAVKIRKVLKHNPVSEVSRPKLRTLEEKTFTVWNQSEQDLFLKAARRHSPKVFEAFVIELFSGCRPGEVVVLTRDCLDFDSRILTIKDTWGKVSKGAKGKTKDKKSRRVKLPLLVWEILASKRSLAPRDRLFPELTYGTLYYQLGRIVELTGLSRLTPHGLRHTFTSTMTNTPGVTLKQIMDTLGHEHSEVTDGYMKKFGVNDVPSTEMLIKDVPSWMKDEPDSEVINLPAAKVRRHVKKETAAKAENAQSLKDPAEVKSGQRRTSKVRPGRQD